MISVIMAAHINSAEKLGWLNEAVASLQSQTLQEWELIIIDDCSSVGIGLDRPDERIRKFRTAERVGPSRARNTGVALASYDAILPLDADDLLAGNNVLESMYAAWQDDRTKIIYGDLQRLEWRAGQYRLGKQHDLPGYTFEGVLDLRGIIPVTAMHSKGCHVRAGGWKPELEQGLEDVEYWIAAGKAGFCGLKINIPTLLYRRHDDSRSHHLRQNRFESLARNTIRKMHSDVFEGRYPMGCCGGGRATSTTKPMAGASMATTIASQLTDVPDGEKVWVQYVGVRGASFDLVGTGTRKTYHVQGTGHKLEIHRKDLLKFQQYERGKGFLVGVKAPDMNGSSPEPKQELDVAAFQAPAPELATVERLDKKALGK